MLFKIRCCIMLATSSVFFFYKILGRHPVCELDISYQPVEQSGESGI